MPRNENRRLAAKLGNADLKRIRDVVLSLHEGNGGPIQHTSLVELSQEASDETVLTVDFESVASMGLPMVIIQSEAAQPANGLAVMLSPREQTVAEMIALGLANKEIAGRLGLSILTVKDHVHRILVKTGLPNRAAVAAALESGKVTGPVRASV